MTYLFNNRLAKELPHQNFEQDANKVKKKYTTLRILH